MGTQSPPSVLLRGQQGQATLLPKGNHHWAAAYLITSPNLDPLIRNYVVLIDLDGHYGIGWASIDEVLATDAREAGLPEAVAVSAQMVGIVGDELSADDAHRVLRFMARAAVRDLPLPPQSRLDLTLWRVVLNALADFTVNDRLTL